MPTQKIKLELDQEDAYDYEQTKSHKFSQDYYIETLLSEVEETHA